MKPTLPSKLLAERPDRNWGASRGLNAQPTKTWGAKPEPEPDCECEKPVPLRRYSGQWLCVCGQFVA